MNFKILNTTNKKNFYRNYFNKFGLRKIFEKQVKTIYIALDDDAKKDAYYLSEFFKDFGIDSKVVNLPKNKDPNDLGFEQMTVLIGDTISSSFSDMISARLYG